MRLSISARIFAGFLVVLAAFGGVMGYTFYRMHHLRQDLHLINKSYLRLALVLAELHTIQGNLLNTIAERSLGRGTSKFLRTQVHLARLYRQREVQLASRIAERTRLLGPSERDLGFVADLEHRLGSLGDAFRRNEPLFDQLFAAPGPLDARLAENEGENLLRLERKLAAQIRRLRDDIRGQVRSAALQVEIDENRAVWAILLTMVIAVLVSFGVTFGSQLTLRPLKTLVAGTKRIGSGDYAHRVAVASRDELGVLGREFNSMAAAIEEREQRLIRSERMAAAGQIASHITHEIRNPLSSISLNTELLEEEFEGDETRVEPRKLCQAIRREVDRLTEITEEYLRFARLPRPHLKREDLNEILLDLISFMSTELGAQRVTVKSALSSGIPAIEADENQLRQAFLNLLRNAGEAMASAGGQLEVSTRTVDGGAVEVRVADTGVGIAEQNIPKLFEPFFSTKESGTGLGLALTQQIIQEHGGTIDVASVPGQGTVFTVRLPAAGGRPEQETT